MNRKGSVQSAVLLEHRLDEKTGEPGSEAGDKENKKVVLGKGGDPETQHQCHGGGAQNVPEGETQRSPVQIGKAEGET